jgi:hypothetical protein
LKRKPELLIEPPPWAGTNGDGSRNPQAPLWWPFGFITPERQRQEASNAAQARFQARKSTIERIMNREYP